MTTRVVVVDDERLARVALRALLSEVDGVQVVGEAASVAEAVELLPQVEHDVVFLDIQMPDGSGFEVLERGGTEAAVVFVTAHAEHALRAFEVNALDYLVKPIDAAALERALARLPRAAPAEPPRLGIDDVVVLREGARMCFVQVQDIACIRSADEYCEVHVPGRAPILATTTMRGLEARLPPGHFLRVHRTAIVNLRRVRALEQVERRWVLQVEGMDEALPVSRAVAAELKRNAAELG